MENEHKGVTISVRTLVIIIIVIILLLIGGITVGLNWHNWFGTAEDTDSDVLTEDTAVSSTFTPDLDENATAYTGQTSSEEDEEPEGIKIPGYPSISLPADTADVTVSLLNPEGNPCYFVFELVLDDTEETLYTSKMVSPGQAITDITLSRALSEGEYDATIKITTYSLEDGSAMNGANVKTTLIVG